MYVEWINHEYRVAALPRLRIPRTFLTLSRARASARKRKKRRGQERSTVISHRGIRTRGKGGRWSGLKKMFQESFWWRNVLRRIYPLPPPRSSCPRPLSALHALCGKLRAAAGCRKTRWLLISCIDHTCPGLSDSITRTFAAVWTARMYVYDVCICICPSYTYIFCNYYSSRGISAEHCGVRGRSSTQDGREK